MTAVLSLGVAGALDHGVLRALAPRVEQAGFHALWVNDTPDGDSLAALAAAAEATTSLVLATGVIALPRRSGAQIAADVAALALPEERLVLGVGSGQLRQGALDAVRRGVEELRERSAARIVVGALGPRMRALGFQEADGALLSWFTPEAAARAGEGRPAGSASILYARAIAEPAARERLEREAARYASFPQYAAHFAREGIAPLDTVIDLAAAPGRLAGFAASVDELVLRAITPGDALEEFERFLGTPAVHPG